MTNFILYFGSGRAGSTWLHGELNKRTDCNLPIQKELFIFQKFLPIHNGFDREKYFETMVELGSNVALTGDITPSNGYASKDQLYWFKENAEKHGLNVLPMMTLRDPVAYAISVSKLQLSANEYLKSGNQKNLLGWMWNQIETQRAGPNPQTVEQIVEIGIPFDQLAIPWSQTVDNVTEVFGKIHFNFYETLFTEESLQKMFAYLELPYHSVKTDKKIFTFGEHPDFSDAEKLRLFEAYPFAKQNYDFAVDRFGKDFIESIWWNPYK